VTSKLKALGGFSSYHLQGAGAYYGGPNAGSTARFSQYSMLSVTYIDELADYYKRYGVGLC